MQPVISKFALIIFGITPTSAPVERLFSKLGGAKTKARCRMDKDTLKSLGIIKLDIINSKKSGKEPEACTEFDSWVYETIEVIREIEGDEEEAEDANMELDEFNGEANVLEAQRLRGKVAMTIEECFDTTMPPLRSQAPNVQMMDTTRRPAGWSPDEILDRFL